MIVILNNKCNLSKTEFIKYQEELKTINTEHEVVLCPTYLNINNCQLETIKIGAQTVSCTDNGAYNGEISARDLKDSGVKYTIVGHSERRKYQNESNYDINEKIKRLLENDITPILCIGETEDERNNGLVEYIINKQLSESLRGLLEEKIKKIIIAYEPIWSIGTGLIPDIDDIINVNNFIKKLYPNNQIIYGGSANEKNIQNLKSKAIDGYLLGGLSLKPEKIKEFLDQL